MPKPQKKNTSRAPKHHSAGTIVKVPSRPLDLTPRPWYPLTVRISTLAGSVLNFQDLFSHLRSQLGLSDTNNLRVRLQHSKIWGPVAVTSSNTVTGQLHVVFYDPVTNSPTQEVIRYPDVVNRSSVGYVYSDAIQSFPVGTLANTLIQFRSPVAAEVANCVIYVHLLWRFIT
jgi:hypothetical protein